MPFQRSDRQHLEAAEGFIELGLDTEAWEELENIEPEMRAHPMVLKRRTKILMNLKRWEFALEIAESRCRYVENDTEAFIDAAYCLHALKRTGEAKEKLLAGPADKWGLALWHYNMGCYECSLGQVGSAKFHLQLAFNKDPECRLQALDDSDLEALWRELRV